MKKKSLCMILATTMLLAGCANSGTEDKPKLVTKNSNEQTENETTSTAAPTEEAKEFFTVGETAEMNDIQVTLVNYEESEGNDWGKPEDGKIFVFPEMEIANNSDEEISVSSMVSFECYVDDYKTDFSSNAFMAISTEDGKQQLDGSVAPGKRLKGVLGIEAPADWKTIEIYYKDNVWLSSNFSFRITK